MLAERREVVAFELEGVGRYARREVRSAKREAVSAISAHPGERERESKHNITYDASQLTTAVFWKSGRRVTYSIR